MNLTKSNESLRNESTTLSVPGIVKQASGRIVDAAIEIGDFVLVTPIFVPDLDDVRAFADKLHKQGSVWVGCNL